MIAPEPGGDSTRTEVPRHDPFAVGRMVAGKYEVLQRLGSGGFGTVFKVRHTRRRKLYALKIPRQEFLDHESFRVRFEREIEAMERFVHPDAVLIRDSGVTDEGIPYYTMDFIEGESLRDVLRREGRLAVDRALEIARHVLRVLQVAHDHQIIHRDIKPDNVLLTVSDGHEAIKVVDFGVAKLLDIVGTTATITGAERVGTPGYMSPEQITGETLDGRSDLFSVGILLYEMLAGQHPFVPSRSGASVISAILDSEPEPLCGRRPEIPRSLGDLVEALLSKRRRSRPASTATVLRSIDAIRENWTPDSPPATTVILAGGPARRPAEALVIRENTNEGEKRRFIFFGERVTLGRSARADSPCHHLILRRLPCRSSRRDPDNWKKNLTISHLSGSLSVDGRLVVVEADRVAAGGIGIGGLERQRGARLGSDRFHLTLGDHALELDGTRYLRSSDRPELDLSVLARGRPRANPASTNTGCSNTGYSNTGYSNPGARVDCIRLLRAENWPLHEYYLLQRAVTIGSAASVPIRLRAPGVRAAHAAIVLEGGEAMLVALEGSVAVEWSSSTEEDDEGRACGLELEPRSMIPLVAGLTLAIGHVRWTVSAVDDSDFKRV